MATDTHPTKRRKSAWLMVLAMGLICLAGCGTGPLIGLVYTQVKLPLTVDLDETPMPSHPPHSDQIIEIKEPFTGLGLYARMNSNALGDIARTNGVERLYFADQEVFSVLGIWKTNRVFLHGEIAPERVGEASTP